MTGRTYGSSPRVRGKRLDERETHAAGRIIPARAGQTSALEAAAVLEPDHPRACGANDAGDVVLPMQIGSSPRVRGKLQIVSEERHISRIIPARAGQTSSAMSLSSRATDHPRACGANTPRTLSASHSNGSSPRVRGKQKFDTTQIARLRIIPARAGQTSSAMSLSSRATDHPRACGANSLLDSISFAPLGSSPRVRGKRSRSHSMRFRWRIIPARAGQTVRFYAKTLERWTLNNWIRTVAPIFVLLFLLPVIGQNAYIERHYSNQSFSWFSKLHYASAFDLSLVA